jgi:hypothetical protein
VEESSLPIEQARVQLIIAELVRSFVAVAVVLYEKLIHINRVAQCGMGLLVAGPFHH